MVSLLFFEVRRIYRSPRFAIFAIGFPVVMFLIFANLYRDSSGAVPYLMVSMAGFGAVSAAISTGSRVAIERQVGWNRQLRMTPLSSTGYLVSKVLAAMLVALPAMLLVFLIGAAAENVGMDAMTWLRVALACWLGVLPIAVLGLLVGMLATGDSAQAMSAVLMLSLSLLGGLWVPINMLPGFLSTIAQRLPSYWLAQFGHDQATGAAISAEGVVVMLTWLVAASALVIVRYRKDAARA